MKVLLATMILSLHLLSSIFAQSLSKYHEVEISITDQKGHKDLQDLGIDIICGSEHKHSDDEEHIILVLRDDEVESLKTGNFDFKILEDDLSKKIERRNESALPLAIKNLDELKLNQVKRGSDVGQDLGCIEQDWPIPSNFKLGSMGGMLTYTELLAELDEMAMKYPNLISTRANASSSLTTIEGRNIEYVRISDNPNVSESEPQVLYTSLHHAREPVSMMSMIFYMWYLLENYTTDPDISRLVDNTEMLFIPCVNPDGYVYNQSTNPNGGGYWRKNRRINSNGSTGVDLNRNYGLQWGINNGGSSSNPNSTVYHGTSAFSEPETQIMKEFVESRNIITAFNNHTYGDLHFYPWGYTADDCPDDKLFQEMSEQMCWHNRYLYGSIYTTIYPVAGVADDWFYGEQTTKNKIMAFTPEVGSNGFWPSPFLVVPQCQNQMRTNLQLAAMASNYGVLNDLTELNMSTLNPTINFSIQHLSSISGQFRVFIEPISPYIRNISQNALATAELKDDETELLSTSFELDPDTPARSVISYKITVSNGTYEIFSRVYSKRYNPKSRFFEPFNNSDAWELGSWGIDTEQGYKVRGSLTDSKNSLSNDGVFIARSKAIDLTDSQGSTLEYFTKWDITNNFDYVQVGISTDGDTPTMLCGTYTKKGAMDGFFSTNQPSGIPLYDGLQEEWVREEFDISAFDDMSPIYIHFIHYGDDTKTHKDGIYIDDLNIYETESAHCLDGILNADEEDIDCGGVDCSPCPTCSDGIQNGNEEDIDCGGPDCPACPDCETLTLEVILDIYPQETTWQIVDENFTNLASGGNYSGQASDTITYSICLIEACYTFTISDSAGDGICCNFGLGSYSLLNESGDQIANGGNFQNTESTQFCINLGDDCPIDLVVPIYTTPDSTYYAENNISSDGIVNLAYNINLSAGNEIQLTEGFEVILDATFHALIGGCEE